jgi:hypothetical protein
MIPKYTLHKLPKGFIITSDEKIKVGDLIIHSLGTWVVENEQGLEAIHDAEHIKKVIAQQDQIDFSALTGEEQKKIGLNQYDFAKMFYDILKATYPEFDEWVEAKEYKKAQELLSDRRFTLEDIRQMFLLGKQHGLAVAGHIRNGTYIPSTKENIEECIQSLSQPKSWKVELEMEDVFNYFGEKFQRPLIRNNKIKILKLL